MTVKEYCGATLFLFLWNSVVCLLKHDTQIIQSCGACFGCVGHDVSRMHVNYGFAAIVYEEGACRVCTVCKRVCVVAAENIATPGELLIVRYAHLAQYGGNNVVLRNDSVVCLHFAHGSTHEE